MNFTSVLWVGLGGCLGSVARYVLSKSIDGKLNTVFPYGTLAVNILGSLILGFVYGVALKKAGTASPLTIFLGVGFCGGFTTFSTFAWENINLLQQRLISPALLYIAVSLVVGLLAIAFGTWLSRFS